MNLNPCRSVNLCYDFNRGQYPSLFFDGLPESVQFQIALKNSDFETAKNLLLNGANINGIDTNTGDTHLLYVCKQIKKLINFVQEDDEKLKFRGFRREDGTSTCVVNEKVNCKIKFLLEAGADPNIPNKKKITPLHLACSALHDDLVKSLIANGASPNVSATNQLLTPLNISCRNKHWPITKFLIENGASIDKRDYKGRTPLHHACMPMLIIISDTFNIALPPCVNVVGSLLREAAKTKNVTLQNCNKKALRIELLSRGVLPLVENFKLLKYVNAQDLIGFTPLHHIIKLCFPCLKIIKLLLKYGANINLKDIKGRTVLHYYVCSNYSLNPSIALLFIRHGADVNATDNSNMTPLQLAFANGNDDLAKLLAENGARVYGHFPDGSSPIHKAMMFKNIETIEFLFSKGMDVFLTNSEGNIFKFLCHISEKEITDFLRFFFFLCLKQAAKNKEGFKNCITELVENSGDCNYFINWLGRCLHDLELPLNFKKRRRHY